MTDKIMGLLVGTGPDEPSSEQTIYFLESYVPEWLAHSNEYQYALQQRVRALMQMQAYNIDDISDATIVPTPDCPAPPGMCVVRVEALVREFDTEVPMDDDEEDASWMPMNDGSTVETLAAEAAKGFATRSSQDG